jgi:hypothetical protein
VNYSTVVGYSYSAGVHCVDCTRKACDEGVLKCDPLHPYASPHPDQNGIPGDACDHEGNIVHPLFLGDCENIEHCGDCVSVLPGTDDLPPLGEE